MEKFISILDSSTGREICAGHGLAETIEQILDKPIKMTDSMRVMLQILAKYGDMPESLQTFSVVLMHLDLTVITSNTPIFVYANGHI